MDRVKEIQLHLAQANKLMTDLVKEGYRVDASVEHLSTWASTNVPIAHFTVEVWQKV